jgi:hypothetical protein
VGADIQPLPKQKTRNINNYMKTIIALAALPLLALLPSCASTGACCAAKKPCAECGKDGKCKECCGDKCVACCAEKGAACCKS